jgi:hypothetical protein
MKNSKQWAKDLVDSTCPHDPALNQGSCEICMMGNIKLIKKEIFVDAKKAIHELVKGIKNSRSMMPMDKAQLLLSITNKIQEKNNEVDEET